MSLRLVITFVGLAIASTYGEKVTCKPLSSSDGSITFDCASSVPQEHLSAQNLYILWLKSRGADLSKGLEINVPNYKIEDVIQAAAKGGEGKAQTSINVKLARPETSYIAQKEDGLLKIDQDFDVSLIYDKITGKNVHFADDGQGSERYVQLREKIQLPPLRSLPRN